MRIDKAMQARPKPQRVYTAFKLRQFDLSYSSAGKRIRLGREANNK